MELKPVLTTIFFLFLFASPYFSRGESDVLDSNEVYEIDYRGPETHSSIPPPDHSRGKPWIHKESSWGRPSNPKSKGTNMGRKVKKIHG